MDLQLGRYVCMCLILNLWIVSNETVVGKVNGSIWGCILYNKKKNNNWVHVRINV